jgi:two-component system chemotaxis response regulator CheY
MSYAWVMANILIIDDDPQVRTFLRSVLEDAGHRLREAVNGVEGLAAFNAERPDLVLCDIFMPEQGGIKTIRAIRRRDQVVPIIAISGGASWDKSSSHLFLTLAQNYGTTRELAKPFTNEALLTAVGEALQASTTSRPTGRRIATAQKNGLRSRRE